MSFKVDLIKYRNSLSLPQVPKREQEGKPFKQTPTVSFPRNGWLGGVLGVASHLPSGTKGSPKNHSEPPITF